MWQMAIAPIASGGLTGHGEAVSNAKNRATKDTLKYKTRAMLELADPLGNAIEGGYQPGGELRGALFGAKAAPVQDAYNRSAETMRAGSWRYGGGLGGLAGQRMTELGRARDEGLTEARIGADTEAEDLLARMQTTRRGYKESMNPATVYDNPYRWVWPSVQAAQQGYESQGGTY